MREKCILGEENSPHVTFKGLKALKLSKKSRFNEISASHPSTFNCRQSSSLQKQTKPAEVKAEASSCEFSTLC